MGTVANILEDWASTDSEKSALYASQKGKIVRWFNEAQLRFTDRSECLQSVWEPTITSTGNIALPSDFKREVKNRVKLDTRIYLVQIPYADANIITNFSDTRFYSIWNNTFYVWQAAACTPSIPYIIKPTAITTTSVSSADSEIPTEYHHYLFGYLDSMWARTKGDVAGSMALLKNFDNDADDVYTDFKRDTQPVPMMRGGFF